MESNKPIKINRRHNRTMVWQVLAIIAAAVVLSLGIATVWQRASGDTVEAQSLPPAPASQPESRLAPPSSEPVSSEAASSAPEPDKPSAPEGALPETERVKSPYFDDAVFVGDSITTGIELYQMMANTTVLALSLIHISRPLSRADRKRQAP